MALSALTLALLAGVVFRGAFAVPFIYDDMSGIVTNASVTRASWHTLLVTPRQTPVAGRPLAQLTLAMNHALGGLDPWGYHAFNTALLWLSGVLLFLLVRDTLVRVWEGTLRHRYAGLSALAAASLWLVHPLQTDVVDYTVQRTESLMGVCVLASLYAATRVMRGGGAAWAMTAVGLCEIGRAHV